MLDLALFLWVMLMLALGLRRPFIWVLAYLYVDILAPQKIGWAIMQSFPVSFTVFCAAFAGWAIADRKEGTMFTLRQGILLALLFYCWWTTANADFPDAAPEKWAWVWKVLVFAIFLPVTLTTRLRIETAATTMVLTAGAIIISAGLKTVGGGGGYGGLYMFVNDNTNIYESSTLATAAIAIIPLIWWLVRHGTVFPDDWRVRVFAVALTFACLLIPIGTEARTGLLCIVALGVLMLREVKKPFLYIGAAVAAGMMALPFLPQSYYDRMATIGEASADESAATRMKVWMWTLDYVRENPMGGGFDAYRGNSFTYTIPKTVKEGSSVAVEYVEVTDQSRAYHSAFFEMLGEQGWPGLFLWLSFNLLGLFNMERIRRRWRNRTGPHENWQASLAGALFSANIVYLVGAAFQGIAYQPFMMMLAGLQIGLTTYCAKVESVRHHAARKAAIEHRRKLSTEPPVADPAMP